MCCGSGWSSSLASAMSSSSIGPVSSSRTRLVTAVRQVHAAADGLFGHRANREVRLQESPLDLGVVGDGGRQREDLLVEVQMDGRFVMRRRHEDAAARRDAQAEYGRRVEIREEDQRVVLLMVALQVLEQRRRPGSLTPQPLHLLVGGVRVVEDPVRELVEAGDVARLGDGEAPHGHAADTVGALRDTRSSRSRSRARRS